MVGGGCRWLTVVWLEMLGDAWRRLESVGGGCRWWL